LLIVGLGIYGLVIILLLNAKIVLKKERKSITHSLTLILALGLILYLVLTNYISNDLIPEYLSLVVLAAYLLFFLYFIHVMLFLVATLLCNFARPKLNQQYIIVHGSGLIDGKVTPLLAGRITRAIEFYNRQKEVTEAPKLVLSGGQGCNEPRSEASAMMEYACSLGIPRGDILLEDKSTSTQENMMFSKQIMDKHAWGKRYNCVFVTSNYHILRTGLYARIARLQCDGIGSGTALYYLPNALIREYIAYVVMHKKRHVTLACTIFLVSVAMSVILQYLTL
jgi:uncharacterized SAM-binding protein YcdF (DUF218 family)